MYIFYGLLVIVLLISTIPLYLFFTEYKPPNEEEANKYRNNRKKEADDVVTITTLNAGFCGRDRAQEFFTDGGHSAGARTREERFDNLISITSELREISSDIFCLQEIDTHGTRTSDINQIEHFASELTNHNIFFAYNYVSKWVQQPLMHPMGNVNSGLALLSKFKVKSSDRIQLITDDQLPKRLLGPKEAMVITRFDCLSLELIVINVHIMPYTKSDELRKRQLEQVINHAAMLYDPLKNHVIIAGDFYFELNKENETSRPAFDHNIIPDGFALYFDHDHPSTRSMKQPYMSEITELLTTDGFIVSKNLHSVSVKTHDYGFRNTNHQPTTLTIKRK